MSSERTYMALAAGALGVAVIAAIAVAHCTGPPARDWTAPGRFLSTDTPGGHGRSRTLEARQRS